MQFYYKCLIKVSVSIKLLFVFVSFFLLLFHIRLSHILCNNKYQQQLYGNKVYLILLWICDFLITLTTYFHFPHIPDNSFNAFQTINVHTVLQWSPFLSVIRLRNWLIFSLSQKISLLNDKKLWVLYITHTVDCLPSLSILGKVYIEILNFFNFGGPSVPIKSEEIQNLNIHFSFDKKIESSINCQCMSVFHLSDWQWWPGMVAW